MTEEKVEVKRKTQVTTWITIFVAFVVFVVISMIAFLIFAKIYYKFAILNAILVNIL